MHKFLLSQRSAYAIKVQDIASIVNHSPAPIVGHVIETTYQPLFAGHIIETSHQPHSQACLNLTTDTCHSVDDIVDLSGEQGNEGCCP